MRWAYFFSVVLMALVAGVGMWWYTQTVERPALIIEAPHDVPALGLPVYAQFVVTQRIRLDRPLQITRLTVPMYLPAEGETMDVRLLQQQRVIQQWREVPKKSGEVVNVTLSFPQTRELQGDLEVQFEGARISARDPDRAPRVFVESADSNYPAGNYRIAANEKEGDVGMIWYETVTRGDVWLEHFRNNTTAAIEELLVGLAAALLLVSTPFIFARSARPDITTVQSL